MAEADKPMVQCISGEHTQPYPCVKHSRGAVRCGLNRQGEINFLLPFSNPKNFSRLWGGGLQEISLFFHKSIACYPLNFGSYVTVHYFPEGHHESSPFTLQNDVTCGLEGNSRK